MGYGMYSFVRSHHYANHVSEVSADLSDYLTEDEWEEYTLKEKETFVLEIGDEVCYPCTPCGYVFLG